MPSRDASGQQGADPAAVFGAAISLYLACKGRARSDVRVNLSDGYGGLDQFMREVMRVATLFEEWACSHIAFSELEDVWPYLVEDRFGSACLENVFPDAPNRFDETDCLRVAMYLELPIRFDDKLPLPIEVTARNSIGGSGFRDFKIQTMRGSIDGENTVPYRCGDEPYDDNFGAPYFALFCIGHDGLAEHIADRATYAETIELLRKLVPNVDFPQKPPDLRSSRQSD
jgi:hypothetical protein